MKIDLRPAIVADEQRLLSWRTDPGTVEFSAHVGEITADDHRKWTADYVALGGMIAEVDGEPIGYVAARVLGKVAHLMYVVDPAWRGKGHGKAMVAQFVDHRCVGLTLAAHIKAGNVASEAIAKGLGLVSILPERWRSEQEEAV